MDGLYALAAVLGFLAYWLARRHRIGEVGQFVFVVVFYTEIVLLGRAIVAEDFPGMALVGAGLVALVPLLTARRPGAARWGPGANSGALRRVAFMCLIGSFCVFGLVVAEAVIGAAIGIAGALGDPQAFHGATKPRGSSGIEDLLFWLVTPTFVASICCAVLAVLAYGLVAGRAIREAR